MYKFRKEKRAELKAKTTITKLAEEIGITRVSLSRIVSNRGVTTKMVAYCLTKLLDSEKEIDYFFERIK